MDRDFLIEILLTGYVRNNELRYDLNKGTALNKGGASVGIPAIFDIADAVLDEAKRRDQPNEFDADAAAIVAGIKNWPAKVETGRDR